MAGGTIAVESGLENCPHLTLRQDHSDEIDKFIEIHRSDIHKYTTMKKMAEYKAMHTRTMEILALYLHRKQLEVARQHMHLARGVSGSDLLKALNAFQHASDHIHGGLQTENMQRVKIG